MTYLTGNLEVTWLCNYCGLFIPVDDVGILELNSECLPITFCTKECSKLFENGQ